MQATTLGRCEIVFQLTGTHENTSAGEPARAFAGERGRAGRTLIMEDATQ
jgi:hypothetical protein